MKKNNVVKILIMILLLLIINGCSTKNKGKEEGKYYIVTTTTMLADAARVVGGDYVVVTGLMGPGIDPHLYKASAGDVGAMQKADMVVFTGLHLEGKMGKVFENLNKLNKKTVNVSNGVDEDMLLQSEDSSLAHDPHIWFDVSLWKDAVSELANGIKELDPEHSEEYENNLNKYLTELDELDAYIKNRALELDEEKRVLITAHDAFNYFGQAYGFQVKGIQGISTSSEAGTRDLRNLANFIVENEIKAIFIESSVPTKNIEALKEAVESQGFDVKIGGELYSDSLGDEKSGDDTYIKTFTKNIDTIVDALK